MQRRRLLAAATLGGIGLLAGCSTGGDGDDGGDGSDGDGDDDPDTPSPTGTDATGGRSLTSSAFADGEPLPTRHSCDGEGASPPLSVGAVPEAATTLALVVDDPDAPTDEPFVHWLVWNVPADLTEWPAGVEAGERAAALDDAPQGVNGGGELGYFPACPPRGDGTHRYRFTLHAVDRSLDVDPGAERTTLASALEGHVLSETRLVGTYERG